MKKICGILLVVVVVIGIGFIVSCSNENVDQGSDVIQNEQQGVETLKSRSEIIRHFDPENVGFYWVKFYGAQAFWAFDDTLDKMIYNGYLVQGTQVNDLVYFLYDQDNKIFEKYFHIDDLVTDPRESNFWLSTVETLYKDYSIKNIYDALEKACCIKVSTPETHLIIDDLVKKMEKQGLINRTNHDLFEINIALLRYTEIRENYSYNMAARILTDINNVGY